MGRVSDRRSRDELYAERAASAGDFVFDESVAAVFPDMIQRSVPGYPAIIHMIRLLAERYAQPGSRLLDLGCSLGASTMALDRGASGRGCDVLGVDNAEPMLDRARELSAESHPHIVWRCADIRDIDVDRVSVAVMNFTLQFVPPDDRLALLRRIYDGLLPDGILILSEKIAADDDVGNALLTDMHHAFKRANGYSELEISRKRNALENVLVPERLTTHRQRLSDAGFTRTDLWFQCFNFVSVVARR